MLRLNHKQPPSLLQPPNYLILTSTRRPSRHSFKPNPDNSLSPSVASLSRGAYFVVITTSSVARHATITAISTTVIVRAAGIAGARASKYCSGFTSCDPGVAGDRGWAAVLTLYGREMVNVMFSTTSSEGGWRDSVWLAKWPSKYEPLQPEPRWALSSLRKGRRRW